MSRRQRKPCRHVGCGILIEAGKDYCDKHKKSSQRLQKMYTYKWSLARKDFLIDNPLCIECKKNNIIKAASVVDHVIPHQGNQILFWDRSNWQSLCIRCHNKKSANEKF